MKSQTYHPWHIAVILFIIALACTVTAFQVKPDKDNEVDDFSKAYPVLDAMVGKYHVSLPEEIVAPENMYNLRAEKVGNTITIFFESPNVPAPYTLEPQDNGNKLILWQEDKVIHVFDRQYNGNTNLFSVVDNAKLLDSYR